MTKQKTFYTDYKTAATCGNCSLVLCNNLPEIDPSVWDNIPSSYYEANKDYDELFEIYQWYITDLSETSKDWQENTFDLLYTYSDLLDCYVLCVTHWGTSWDYVPCEVKSNNWIEVNKNKEYNKG